MPASPSAGLLLATMKNDCPIGKEKCHAVLTKNSQGNQKMQQTDGGEQPLPLIGGKKNMVGTSQRAKFLQTLKTPLPTLPRCHPGTSTQIFETKILVELSLVTMQNINPIGRETTT